ncbi:MAG: Hsp33 family molecular chaperone [Nitratireductor sp.]|nr:Hsp33 family molecular chaperone [Nitratireductor sp.]
MTEQTTSPLGAITLAGDDKVVPFQVSPLDTRGRAVQLGPMLNTILERHDYPRAVAALLGETIVLTVLLGTSLKFEGKFIVQTQSDGPVSLLVVDFRTPGAVRAYARYDAERVDEAVRAGQSSPKDMLGRGILAMTIDQGVHTQRYQGIVELNGISLEDAAMQYFRQSEQIPTVVRLAVAEIMTPAAGGGFAHAWRAGGLVAQFLPEAPERIRVSDLPGGDDPRGGGEAEAPDEDDAWVEAKALVETISDDELTDPQIGSERLLYRLFHEHGVRVFPGAAVEDKCSCSREKIVEIVRSFSKEEQADSMEDGRIVTTCEFCSTVYTLTADDLGG